VTRDETIGVDLYFNSEAFEEAKNLVTGDTKNSVILQAGQQATVS
jgi:hypothetical protein